MDGLLILPYALCSLPYALSLLQCHLDVTAGAFFGAKTAPLAEVQVEFIQPSFRRNLNSIVRAVHIAIATVIAKPTAKTSLRFIDNRLRIEGRIKFLEMLQPHVDGQSFFLEPSLLVVVVSVQVFGMYHRRA